MVVIGAEQAPNLLTALEQQGLQALPPVPDVEAAVRAQRVDLALRISDSYARRLARRSAGAGGAHLRFITP